MKYLLVVLFSALLYVQNSFGQSKLIDSLQRIVSIHAHDSVELKALLALSEEFSRKDISRARSYLYQLATLSRQLNRVQYLSGAYSFLITLHQNTGMPDSSRYYIRKCEELARSYPGNWIVQNNYNRASGLFYKNQGLYKEALPFVLQSLKLVEKNGNTVGIAGQLLNVGNLYNDIGQLKNAATYHLRSLKLFEEAGNKRGQSFALQSLGSDYLELNQYASAKKYFERSIEMKKELKDPRGIINAQVSLGDLMRRKKEYRKSEQYFTEGRKSAREMKLTLEEARLEYGLGKLYRDIKKTDQSKASLDRSLLLSKQAGDSALCAEIRSAMLTNNAKDVKEKQEENILQGTILATEQAGKKNSVADAYLNLAEYYAAHDQFEKAYRNYKIYDQLQDSLQSDHVLFQISQMETQYETEKKEKEIALLKKEQQLNEAELKIQKDRQLLIGIALISVIAMAGLFINRYRVLNQTRRQLEMERMRSTIAQDLHDDIGSTLSSINIISQLALQQTDKGNENYFQRINEQSSKMMESISDIVWSINPNNDSMEQMVLKMKEFASEILEPKEIRFSFEGAESVQLLPLDLSKRKNLFLIFKEAINNAAKHSQATELKISFVKNASVLQLTIADNGIGFDAQSIKQGNGQNNLKERAIAAGGVLTVDTAPGKGTTLHLNLPLP